MLDELHDFLKLGPSRHFFLLHVVQIAVPVDPEHGVLIRRDDVCVVDKPNDGS